MSLSRKISFISSKLFISILTSYCSGYSFAYLIFSFKTRNIDTKFFCLCFQFLTGHLSKRLIHLIFNCSGVVFFMIAGWLLGLFSAHRITYGNLFETMFPGAPQTQLAMFHTFFNVVTVICILPLTNLLVNLVVKMVPDSKDVADPDAPRLHYVDDNMLKTPPVAVQQTKKEIVRMSELAMENFNRALRIVTSLTFAEKDKFEKTEDEINFINRALVVFVLKLSE